MKILEVFGEPILNGGQEAFVVSFVKEIDSEQFHFDLLTPYTSIDFDALSVRLFVLSFLIFPISNFL